MKILACLFVLLWGVAAHAQSVVFEKDAIIRTDDFYGEEQLKMLAIIGAGMADSRRNT